MSVEMRRVIVEAPYSGWSAYHFSYMQDCMADCLSRREAPLVGHWVYPARLGPVAVDATIAWEDACDVLAIYVDLGVTHNMRQAMVRAFARSRMVDVRALQNENGPVAERVRLALLGRPGRLVNAELCSHQLDVAVLHQRTKQIVSWRCGCGTVGPTEEEIHEVIREAVAR